MQISVTDAKGQLTELMRRAEAGDDVILTRHGKPVMRLVPISAPSASREQKRALLERLRAESRNDPVPETDAAHSQDFLYDEHGLPK